MRNGFQPIEALRRGELGGMVLLARLATITMQGRDGPHVDLRRHLKPEVMANGS